MRAIRAWFFIGVGVLFFGYGVKALFASGPLLPAHYLSFLIGMTGTVGGNILLALDELIPTKAGKPKSRDPQRAYATDDE